MSSEGKGARLGKVRSILFTASAFIALGGVLIASRSQDSVLGKGRVPARFKVVPLGEGEPWYGGKPSISVRVESDVQGEIPAGDWVPVTLSIFTDMDCHSVSTRLRGVDGLEVVSTEESQACGRGAPVLHEARVRVIEGASGLIAVDIEAATPEGPKFATRAIPFRAASSSISGTE
jgi:hypothetical protein